MKLTMSKTRLMELAQDESWGVSPHTRVIHLRRPSYRACLGCGSESLLAVGPPQYQGDVCGWALFLLQEEAR